MVAMTDFYSVLQRAVSSLPDGSGANRRAVYDKARKALLKQLQSFDPPLPSSDVTAQRLALEDAIRKIENEIARKIRTQRALQTAIPAGGVGARMRSAAGSHLSAPASDTERRAEEERAAQRAAEAARAREEHAAMLANAVSEATAPEEALDIEEEDEDERDHAELRTAPVPARVVPGPRESRRPPADDEYDDARMFEADPEYDEVDPVEETDALLPADIVEGEYDEVNEAEEEEAYEDEIPAVDPREEKRRRQEEAKARKEEERLLKAERRNARKAKGKDRKKDTRGAAAREARPKKEPRERRRGALGSVVFPVVILALLAGAAYAAYTQREALLSVLDNFQEDPAQRPPITVTGRGVTKNSDRLPNTLDGEDTRAVTTTTWPPQQAGGSDAEGAESAEGGSDVADDEADTSVAAPSRTVGEDVSPFAAETDGSAAEEQIAAVDEGATADDESAEDQSLIDEAEAPTPAAPSSPITDFTASGTQPAVLYEEAAQSGENGSAVPGGVEWSMVRQSVGGGDPEPVIRATAEIPDRNMTATITVRENNDGALPASHLIEISFAVPEGFEGGGVKNVPGVIMKESEQSRGEALRGAAARVSSGLFWIALSENDADKENNLRLLRDRDWIDIPILYESGRRAILTLRKGDDGFQSVDAAIKAWSAG